MVASRDLTVRFLGNTSDLTGNIDGVSSKFGVLAKGVAAAGLAVGAALIGGGKALFDIGAQFDDLSDGIRVGTGATGAALDGLVGSAKNVGTQVPSSFADVGVAVTGLNQRLGLTGPALESTASQVLNLSRITGTDLQGNIEGVTRVFGNWGLGMDDQADALDRMFRATQLTGVSITSLQDNLVKFGEPLRQLGFSFEESIALLSSFEKSGVNTEIVLKGMGKGLMKFAKDGEAPAIALDRVIASIKNAGSAADANKIAVELFGKSGIEMAGAIRSGKFEIGELTKTLEISSGSINSAAEDTADFAEKWVIFKNKMMVALEPIATKLFVLIGDKMEVFTGIVERNMPAIQAAVTVAGVAIGVVFDVLLGAITGIATGISFMVENWRTIAVVLGIMSPILVPLAIHFAAMGVAAMVAGAKSAVAWALASAGATRAAIAHGVTVLGIVAGWVLVGVQSLLNAGRVALAWVIAMGPIGWVIAAVIGLVALIIANWDTIVRWTTQAWNAVSGVVMSTVRMVVNDVTWLVGSVWRVLTGLATLGLRANEWFSGLVFAAMNKGGELIGFLVGLPGRALGALGNLGGMLYNSGVALVSGFLDGIVSRWNQLMSWLRNGIATVRNLFPYSPAKEGPFSGRGYVTYSGKALTHDFATSIRSGMPEVLASVRGVLSAAQGGLSATVTPLVARPSGGAAQGAGRPIVINSGGTRLDDLLVEVLRTAIRERGGDPSVVGL